MKFVIFILLIFISTALGAVYGALHDQLTYSISEEYYTKFKFIQFHLLPQAAPPRLLVAEVGMKATWWMGTFIGIILGLVSTILPRWLMFHTAIRAMAITTGVAFLCGLIGLWYGFQFLAKQDPSTFSHWYIPKGLVDFNNYIAVGSMHNFSYLGGVVGLVAGKIYILYCWRRERILSRGKI